MEVPGSNYLNMHFYFSGKYFFITFAVRKKEFKEIYYGQSLSDHRKKTDHR